MAAPHRRHLPYKFKCPLCSRMCLTQSLNMEKIMVPLISLMLMPTPTPPVRAHLHGGPRRRRWSDFRAHRGVRWYRCSSGSYDNRGRHSTLPRGDRRRWTSGVDVRHLLYGAPPRQRAGAGRCGCGRRRRCTLFFAWAGVGCSVNTIMEYKPRLRPILCWVCV